MKFRYLFLVVFVFMFVPFAHAGITYQPDILPEIEFNYDSTEYAYRLEYRDYFLVVQPYAVYNHEVYTLKQIIPFIQSNYPSVTYRQVINKFAKYHRWGFWLENLPSELSDNIQAVGYRLVDTNIPGSAVEYESDPEMNISRLNFKNGFTLDFSDLEARYDVTINKTHIHVTGITGLQDIDLDPITYAANTITLINDGINGIKTNPYNFEDIYNADIAGGWGVVTKPTPETYLLNAKIVLQANSSNGTFLNDTDKVIICNSSIITGSWQYFFDIKQYCAFRLGTYTSVTYNVTSAGCDLIFTPSYTYDFYGVYKSNVQGEIVFLGCNLICIDKIFDIDLSGYPASGSHCKMVNTHINKLQVRHGWTLINCQIYNLECNSNINRPMKQTYVYNTKGFMGDNAVYLQLGVQALNVQGTYYGIGEYREVAIYQITEDKFLYNCLLYKYNDGFDNDWIIEWQSTSGSYRLYRQYGFELKVKDNIGTPIENAVVTVYYANNSIAYNYTTNNNGDSPRRSLTIGYYTQSTGSTLNQFQPYRLTITHPEYLTYNTFNISIYEPVSWEITLEERTSFGTGYYLLIIVVIFALITVVTGKK